MKGEELRKHILGFMYAERVKSALIIAGQLLDALSDLAEGERAGGLKMFASFVKGASNEMRIAANIMAASDWDGLSGQLSLTEGYARLGQMEAAVPHRALPARDNIVVGQDHGRGHPPPQPTTRHAQSDEHCLHRCLGASQEVIRGMRGP